MTRILFWIALLILVVLAVRSKLRAMRPPPGEGRQPGQSGEIETVVPCEHCHMYFPASEAVRADGKLYCSPDHVRLPPK